jgi:hypothetical protein
LGKKSVVPFLFVALLTLSSSFFSCSPISAKSPDRVLLISQTVQYISSGETDYLYIYTDGSVICVTERSKSKALQASLPVKIYKTGVISQTVLDSLFFYYLSSGFSELNSYYQFWGKQNWDEDVTFGDMGCTFTFDFGACHKNITALGYLSPDGGLTYPDMPHPLDEIFQRLREIAGSAYEKAQYQPCDSALYFLSIDTF